MYITRDSLEVKLTELVGRKKQNQSTVLSVKVPHLKIICSVLCRPRTAGALGSMETKL